MKANYLELVKESIDRMEQNMGGRLCTNEIAAAAHYSYPHFARVFSDVVGMPPVTYVARRSLTRAAEILLTTEREIADIALDCGFESQQTFTRSFTGEFGMPPHKYRKRGIPDGMTLPFAFMKEAAPSSREIILCELKPMKTASFSSCGHVLPKRREKQWERIVGEAWTGLISWQMALEYRREYGRDAKLPSVKEQGRYFVERGFHVPPHTRYFGYNHPYPCPDTAFGYVALAQVDELTPKEDEDARQARITLSMLPGGLYAMLPAAYGTGSDLAMKWKELHTWLAGNPEYDYGVHPWLEEHITLPEKGGFHGFRLYMAIRAL
jgi:AraC-like DNA-binding protein/DNA gyrase inhibitor GyrI